MIIPRFEIGGFYKTKQTSFWRKGIIMLFLGATQEDSNLYGLWFEDGKWTKQKMNGDVYCTKYWEKFSPD